MQDRRALSLFDSCDVRRMQEAFPGRISASNGSVSVCRERVEDAAVSERLCSLQHASTLLVPRCGARLSALAKRDSALLHMSSPAKLSPSPDTIHDIAHSTTPLLAAVSENVNLPPSSAQDSEFGAGWLSRGRGGSSLSCSPPTPKKMLHVHRLPGDPRGARY
jgi:hypothetical protein